MAQILGGSGGAYTQASGVWAGHNGEWVPISTGGGGGGCEEFPGPFVERGHYANPWWCDFTVDLTRATMQGSNSNPSLQYIHLGEGRRYAEDYGGLSTSTSTSYLLQGSLAFGTRVGTNIQGRANIRISSASPAPMAQMDVTVRMLTGSLQNTEVSSTTVTVPVEHYTDLWPTGPAFAVESQPVVWPDSGSIWGWFRINFPRITDGNSYYVEVFDSVCLDADTGLPDDAGDPPTAAQLEAVRLAAMGRERIELWLAEHAIAGLDAPSLTTEELLSFIIDYLDVP